MTNGEDESEYPKPTEPERERQNNSPRQWFMTVGFTAFGPHDARYIAMDVAEVLDGTLPGFDRADVAIFRNDDPGVVSSIYCDRHEHCRRIPGHLPPCEDADGTELDGMPRQDGDES